MSDDQLDLTWDGSAADSTPLAHIVLSGKWRDLLLGLVDVLRQPDLWSDTTDFDDLETQLGELERRLMGEDEEIMFDDWGPFYISPPHMIGTADANLVLTFDSASLGHMFVYNSPPVNGDVFCSVAMYLPAGSYTIKMGGSTNYDRGVFRVQLVGPLTYVLGSHDQYTATPITSAVWSYMVNVEATGKYLFQIENIGKNVVSSNYYGVYSFVAIRRDS